MNWCSTGLYSWTFTLPDLHDFPQECKIVNVFLFTDDTNSTAVGTLNAEIESDLKRLSYWLNANKLVLKKLQVNMMHNNRASSNMYKTNYLQICYEPICKYLGVLIESKLSFQTH